MDPLTILQLAIQYGPAVKAVIDAAMSNDDLLSKLKQVAAPLVPLLEQAGSKMFPNAAPALHAVGAALAAFDPNTTKWLQGALNSLVTPSPNLVVDGIYGPRTAKAVTDLQTQMGLRVDGIAGMITQAAIQAALGKLSAPKSA
jgi:murein L,D-transpeptidase YcbB/YkuD